MEFPAETATGLWAGAELMVASSSVLAQNSICITDSGILPISPGRGGRGEIAAVPLVKLLFGLAFVVRFVHVPADVARFGIAKNVRRPHPFAGLCIPFVVAAAIPATNGFVLHLIVGVGAVTLDQIGDCGCPFLLEKLEATVDIQL